MQEQQKRLEEESKEGIKAQMKNISEVVSEEFRE